MTAHAEAAKAFLAGRRIAVAGVSRSGKEAANAVYRKLREMGYRAFAVNPNADEVEGDVCYPDLRSLPEPLDGVVIATHPDVSGAVVRECIELGIPRVWMHRSFGQGSVSDEAVALCREHEITAIPGGCPMMHLEPVDVAHRCMRWLLGKVGKLPQTA